MWIRFKISSPIWNVPKPDKASKRREMALMMLLFFFFFWYSWMIFFFLRLGQKPGDYKDYKLDNFMIKNKFFIDISLKDCVILFWKVVVWESAHMVYFLFFIFFKIINFLFFKEKILSIGKHLFLCPSVAKWNLI